MDPITAKEMTVFPGMELMSALFYVEEFYKTMQYDVVVMDTAPTADTLRLLSFPEISDWYFEKLYKIFRNTDQAGPSHGGQVHEHALAVQRVPGGHRDAYATDEVGARRSSPTRR